MYPDFIVVYLFALQLSFGDMNRFTTFNICFYFIITWYLPSPYKIFRYHGNLGRCPLFPRFIEGNHGYRYLLKKISALVEHHNCEVKSMFDDLSCISEQG